MLDGFRTNHSLRATAATRLYSRGVDEQTIQEVTGHKSLAVRKYKRTPTTLKRRVSDLLYCNETNEKYETVTASASTEISGGQNAKKVCITINLS